jgi:hypothetical protein
MKSNRAGFFAFSAVKASSARTEILQAAAPRALEGLKHLEWTTDYLRRVSLFRSRRNEISHGMVLNLGEFGFQFCQKIRCQPNGIEKGLRRGRQPFNTTL